MLSSEDICVLGRPKKGVQRCRETSAQTLKWMSQQIHTIKPCLILNGGCLNSHCERNILKAFTKIWPSKKQIFFTHKCFRRSNVPKTVMMVLTPVEGSELLFLPALLFSDPEHVFYWQNFPTLTESTMCQCQNPFHQVSYCKESSSKLPHQVEKGHASLFSKAMFSSKCKRSFLWHSYLGIVVCWRAPQVFARVHVLACR